MRPSRPLLLAVLLAFAGCGDPSYLFGGTVRDDDAPSPRGGAVILNGGTSTGAWIEDDTSTAQPPAVAGSEAPAAADPSPSPTPEEQPPAPAPVGQPAPAPACGDAFEQEVLDLVNDVRAQYGRAPLRCDPGAAAVADAFSGYMCQGQFFSHVAPDGSTPVSRLAAAGVTYRGMGENIAAGQATPAKVVDDWMHSPGHRENILGSFTHLGVGYKACANPHYHYWTQSFLRR